MSIKQGIMGVYAGGSRMGKTAALKQQIIKGKKKRVIVWSVKEQIDKYYELAKPLKVKCLIAENKAELIRAIKEVGKNNGLIIYTPKSLKDFDFWSKAAFAFGKLKPCVVVAEETADVTTPAKAPEGYGVLIRQCLGWGIDLYAVTQRPAESDKTIMGNCTFIHCHFMTRAADRKYMAAEMNIKPEQIEALKPLEFIETNGGEKSTKHGKVVFK